MCLRCVTRMAVVIGASTPAWRERAMAARLRGDIVTLSVEAGGPLQEPPCGFLVALAASGSDGVPWDDALAWVEQGLFCMWCEARSSAHAVEVLIGTAVG